MRPTLSSTDKQRGQVGAHELVVFLQAVERAAGAVPGGEALLQPRGLAVRRAIVVVVGRLPNREGVERVLEAGLRLDRAAVRRLLPEDQQPRLRVRLA